MEDKLEIYIADDHNVVRKGMTRLLKTFARVGAVQEATNGRDLIEMITKKLPDAVILDIEMQVMGGLDTARYLVDHFPDVKILILTMHTEEIFVSRLMELGVHGFLSKTSEPEEVEKALYSIVDKDFYRNDLVQHVFRKIKKQSAASSTETLSNREIEVLILICQEYSPGEISRRLNISEKTFFSHRSNIILKTGARNNIGLYKFALQQGYLE